MMHQNAKAPHKKTGFKLVRKPKTVLLLIIAFHLGGCQLAYRTLLGIDTTPHWKSNKQIERETSRYRLPGKQAYALDTASLHQAILRHYLPQRDTPRTADDSLQFKRLRKALNDDLQPVQIRFFKADGSPIFKLVNCYLDPPIPMRWNVAGSFDQFPPANDIAQLNDFLLPMDFFLPHLHPLSPESEAIHALPKADYYAILLWNDFMIRPSRKLIKQMRRYEKAHAGQHIHFLFVNNHNACLWPHLDSTARTEIQNMR